MDKRSVRRRIVTGSLAAPVVLTVSSASATSLTSFGRCLRNGGAAAPDFFAPSKTADNWFRKSVNVHELSFKGIPQGEFYLDPVRAVYVSTRPPHSALAFGSRLPNFWTVSAVRTRWALVYFDGASAGQYRHITLQRPSGYRPATVSCYSSFRMT